MSRRSERYARAYAASHPQTPVVHRTSASAAPWLALGSAAVAGSLLLHRPLARWGAAVGLLAGYVMVRKVASKPQARTTELKAA
ncbi:MAG: hypothetical protein ACYC6M_13655 [Terriglobales bacterium]